MKFKNQSGREPIEDKTEEILEKAKELTVERFATLAERFAKQGNIVSKEKGIYEGKLEKATGGDVFKYLLLINVKALESYTLQTREHTEQSFKLSKWVALAGFYYNRYWHCPWDFF